MDYEEALTEIRALCVEHLGEGLGARLATLAKPGFALKPAHDDAPQTGRCRVGGPALLEPGTPWPETSRGFPLSLVAVLDADELGPWLGEQLPTRLGLVNVFWIQPDFQYREDGRFAELMKPYERWWGQRDGPGDCRIVLADPSRAVEIPAPPPAHILKEIGLHAAPIITLPSVAEESNDPVLKAFHFAAVPDLSEDERGLPADKRFGEIWDSYCTKRMGYWPGQTQAFGWPFIDQWVGKREEDYAHLLTVSGDLWDDEAGFERIMVSQDDLRTGTFVSVAYEQDGLH